MVFVKTCHVCQVVGKPNQAIPVAPLQPIPTVLAPFKHIIIDCVGPLPRSSSGRSYLLTVMCQSTRYPEAYPLRSINARSILKALTTFMSIFGIPEVIQSDQGSNFMSREFAKVLKQLRVRHGVSSAYHPQSQGALERFHQTLKSLLRTYCEELGRDWEEGLPWLMMAVREVTQESTGFSPNDLVFGHEVRGPVAVVTEKWRDVKIPENIIDHVGGFHLRLHHACVAAQRGLKDSQSKMKKLYDRRAKLRNFEPGDKVMALLPVEHNPLYARFVGPYEVDEKVSDLNYVVRTPDRRKRVQLCHINLLKPYYERVPTLPFSFNSGKSKSPECPVSSVLHSVTSPLMQSSKLPKSEGELEEGEVQTPGEEVMSGKLNNSAYLKDLTSKLSYLSKDLCDDLSWLLEKYHVLFPDTPTRTNVLEHDIELGDSKPIKQRFYRIPLPKKQFLSQEIEYMLQNKIARPTFSEWASPCILVKKADGTLRFCTDYRKVNAITKVDSFPLPRMEDCIDQIGSANFVTKLDLLKGFWQVPLTARAQDISAFITPDGLYTYNVMPFGLKNAPSTFQRLMNKVLDGLEGCAAYLDDVVVFSDTWPQHMERLEKLFIKLATAELTVNLSKCEFAKATVQYLGKIVGKGVVRPVEAKVEAIWNFPVPTNRTELLRFLGMTGYYRSFCPNFSTVVAPLTDLLRKDVPYVWNKVCQKAFDRAKLLLCGEPVLAAPQFDKPFLIQVDASSVGAGAVLLQPDSDQINRPVCYFSRKLNDHQKNYSVIEQEALALIWALQHFEVYVGSVAGPVTIFTDHNPLVFLKSIQNPNQRLMRWSLFLQNYDLNIQHIKGSENVIADALSRAPI